MVPTPTPQPNDTKGVRTRQRILESAARVLGERGYAGTRLSEVSAGVGLQTAALYYHFASREDLIAAVVREGTALVHDHVSARLAELDASTDALGRIDVAIDAHLRTTLEMSDFTVAAIRNLRQLPDAMQEEFRATEAEYGRLWRDLLADADEAGLLREGMDLYLTRMLVLGALNWTAEWWRPETVPLDEAIRNTQLLVRRGIMTRPTPDAAT